MSQVSTTEPMNPNAQDKTRHNHPKMNSAIAGAVVIALLGLFLRSCNSDGSTWLWNSEKCDVTYTSGTGAPGKTGSQGTPGTCTSTYEEWLAEGHTGTRTEFLQWLKGVKGDDGVPGAVGPQGVRGYQGLMGLTGAQGPIGLNGAQGAQGSTGLTGAQGPIGLTGAQGPIGLTGPQGPAGTSGMGDSASFWDLTQQGDDGAGGYLPDTAYPMQFGQADLVNNTGITMTAGNTITFTHAGVYNIAFSAQITRSQGGTSSNMSIWLAKNGVNVDDTTTDFTLQSNATRYVAAWNFFVPVTCTITCDTYQLMWSAESEYTAIVYIAPQTAPTRPAIPSLILTVNQVK